MPNSQQKINIVMFNMSSYSEWDKGVQNRNYHILQTLLLDERVGKIIAIDYLPHTGRRFLRNLKENIIAHKGYRILEKTLLTKVLEVSDRLVIYSSVLSKISSAKFYFKLNQFLANLNFNDFIIWSYYPLEVGYFEKMPKAKLFVFDAVDHWAEHPSYRKFKNLLQKNYKIIDERADLIFIVAEELHHLFNHQEKVFWFPNGVDLKHYQQEFNIINRDIGSLPRPIVGYSGIVQERFDTNLFEYLVKQNPDKSFVVIGPFWQKSIKKRLNNYPNIYFLGRKSYQEIPMYLQQFDVGLIPHKVDQFIQYTNPMKMYEYLACGKPVVATPVSGINQFKELVYSTDDYQQFNQYLNRALKEDSSALKEKRLGAVKEHSWLKRVDKMLELIKQRV